MSYKSSDKTGHARKFVNPVAEDLAALALADERRTFDLRDAMRRNPRMTRELVPFSFTAIARVVGGLLTFPENQPATPRLECLLSMAAVHCRGTRTPSPSHYRTWLDEILLKDLIGRSEDPVEDVFVSTAASSRGSGRLFNGVWGQNDFSVESVIFGLQALADETWARRASAECSALLLVSEIVAIHANVQPHVLSNGGESMKIRPAMFLGAAEARSFVHDEHLRALDVSAREVEPFLLRRSDIAELATQAIGASSFERRPLVAADGGFIVALPTAIGAAIQRHAIEAAAEAGALLRLEAAVRDHQFSKLLDEGLGGLGGTMTGEVRQVDQTCHDLEGLFDEGAHMHVLHLGEDLTEILENGLRSQRTLSKGTLDLVMAVAERLAAKPGYRRGLTLIVSAGFGRPIRLPYSPKLPQAWHLTIVAGADLLRFCWEHDFDAVRMWKLLDQQKALPSRGYVIENGGGFANLYAYCRSHGMEMVPPQAREACMLLDSGHVAGVRQELRWALDEHVAPGPRRDVLIPVRRAAARSLFRERVGEPSYVSPQAIASGTWSGCVETTARTWWVDVPQKARRVVGRTLEFQIWDLARNWLLRSVAHLEKSFPGIPSGSLGIRIDLPEVDTLVLDEGAAAAEAERPDVQLANGEIVITAGNAFLTTFARLDNVADRAFLAALVEAAALLAGTRFDPEMAATLVKDVAGASQAKLLHLSVPRTPTELVHWGVPLRRPRLVQPEDVASARLGLAELAGWTGGPGPLPAESARQVLHSAVSALGGRARALMREINRESLIMVALANHDALVAEGSTWRQTASALLSSYCDEPDVVSSYNAGEAERAMAMLASRAIVEMAVCESPERIGRPASTIDFDTLMADVATFIHCAHQDDALHWELAAGPPVVEGNGSIISDPLYFAAEHTPYMLAQGERTFRTSAGDFADPAVLGEVAAELDPLFHQAVEAELGIGLQAYARFVENLAQEAADLGTTVLRLTRSEIWHRLREASSKLDTIDVQRASDALTLRPRLRWDDPKPKGAAQRDWYPWRNSRRLSLLHRPMVQVEAGGEFATLLAPALLDQHLNRLSKAYAGLLPADLFSTKKMRSWIGRAVDRDGHAFNGQVARRLEELGWRTVQDRKLTQFGGSEQLGDIDVLAWHMASGVVHAIECKRLQPARTVGEIGERLAEYGSLSITSGERTPIGKHCDRLNFLRANLSALSAFTMIPEGSIDLKSALITDRLMPMQFSHRPLAFVDLVSDFASLKDAFNIGY